MIVHLNFYLEEDGEKANVAVYIGAKAVLCVEAACLDFHVPGYVDIIFDKDAFISELVDALVFEKLHNKAIKEVSLDLNPKKFPHKTRKFGVNGTGITFPTPFVKNATLLAADVAEEISKLLKRKYQ